jgi:hypothetical protein
LSRNTKGTRKGKKREVTAYLRDDVIARLEGMRERHRDEGLRALSRSDLIEAACMLYLETYDRRPAIDLH